MLKKVSANDPLEIPASTYNAFIDATRKTKQKNGFNSKASKHETPYYVQNKTGKRLPIYSVLMVTDLALDFPDSSDDAVNLNWFISNQIVFKGMIPDKTSIHFHKIIITQEPLEIDAVGVGIMDGFCKCNMKLKKETIYKPFVQGYLNPEDGNTDYLLLGNFGTIEAIFIPTSAVERITQGVCNLGGAVLPYYFLVELSWKSGGDSTTIYEPRLYDILLNNQVIQINVDIGAGNNPYRRPQDYNVTKATMAMGFYAENGEVLIAWANEYPLLGTAEVLP